MARLRCGSLSDDSLGTRPVVGRHIITPGITGKDDTSVKRKGRIMAREDDRILGAQEVADLLDMNVQMVRKYAREGRLPAYRLPGGRTFKFFRSEILESVRSFPVAVSEFASQAG